MDYIKKEKESYNLYYFKSKKFKEISIRIDFKEPVNKENIVYRNLLSIVLTSSTKKIKSKRLIAIAREELYDMIPYSYSIIDGNYNVLSYEIDFLDETCTEVGNNSKSLDFLLELIFNPNIKHKKFYDEYYKEAIDSLKRRIESFNDEPKNVASNKFNNLLVPNTSGSLIQVGYMEDLDKVNGSKLYKYYKNMIETNLVDIYVFGNIELDLVESKLDRYFINKPTVLKTSYFIEPVKTTDKLIEVKETKDVNETILLLGCKVYDLTSFEKWYVSTIYNIILGASPSSKLFKNVREKNSLCYSVSSYYDNIDSTEMIDLTIDSKNYKKSVSLINEEIDNMKKGLFSEDDIKEAILKVENSLNTLDDSPMRILRMYQMHEKLGADLKEDRYKNIHKVTKKDIVKFANKINLEVIYMLEGSKRK